MKSSTGIQKLEIPLLEFRPAAPYNRARSDTRRGAPSTGQVSMCDERIVDDRVYHEARAERASSRLPALFERALA